MNQKATLLIWTVLFLTSVAIAAFGVCAATDCHLLPTSVAHLIDRSPITLAIMVVFSVGVVTNGINTMFVLRQQALVSDGVRETHSRRRHRVSGRGLLGLHIERLYEMGGDHSMESVSQSTSLNVIRNQLFRREWLVRSASSLLLTLGLVGTVLGLTKSLGGLSTTVNAVARDTLQSVESESEQSPTGSVNAESSDMSVGLNQALGGMASAFLTTLFGAVLGGVCLKLLCGCTECFTEELVDRIELLTETTVLPHLRVSPAAMIQRREREFRKWAEQMESLATQEFERFGELSARIGQVTDNFESMAKSMKRAEKHVAGSRAQVATLIGMHKFIERWERFTSSRMAIVGTASCALIAVIGIARFCVELVF